MNSAQLEIPRAGGGMLPAKNSMNIIVKVYLNMERVPPDCHVFSSISSCHGVKQPTSAEKRMLGTATGSYADYHWLAGVAPEANLGECTSCSPLRSVNKATRSALKPRADITRLPKQRYQWPHERTPIPTSFKNKNAFQ